MTLPPEWLYPPALLEARAEAERSGTFRDKVKFDLIPRANYAFGLLCAADIARFCGIKKLIAIEFGVAEGDGLINMAEIAKQVEAETGIGFDVVGFDTGSGLPTLEDARDHPEIWSVGDFDCVSPQALEARLPGHARIIWGEVRDTVPGFAKSIRADTPIGFVANDLDLYSSTIASFALYDAAPEKFLPVVPHYFDDTLGAPTRIGSLFRNRAAGQLGAIEDFNREQPYRIFDKPTTLKARRPLAHALWLEQIYLLHLLDHPFRQVGANRSALRMGEHAADDVMLWPL